MSRQCEFDWVKQPGSARLRAWCWESSTALNSSVSRSFTRPLHVDRGNYSYYSSTARDECLVRRGTCLVSISAFIVVEPARPHPLMSPSYPIKPLPLPFSHQHRSDPLSSTHR